MPKMLMFYYILGLIKLPPNATVKVYFLNLLFQRFLIRNFVSNQKMSMFYYIFGLVKLPPTLLKKGTDNIHIGTLILC